MTDMTVANEINRQLGCQFRMMTGAKDFVGGENYLQFKLSRFQGVKINHIKIELTARDDYTITFGRMYGLKYKVLNVVENVTVDILRDAITSATGLDTKLF